MYYKGYPTIVINLLQKEKGREIKYFVQKKIITNLFSWVTCKSPDIIRMCFGPNKKLFRGVYKNGNWQSLNTFHWVQLIEWKPVRAIVHSCCLQSFASSCPAIQDQICQESGQMQLRFKGLHLSCDFTVFPQNHLCKVRISSINFIKGCIRKSDLGKGLVY